MNPAHHFDTDFVFDILRGVAAFTKRDLVGQLAETVARFPKAELSVAFNAKQVASKIWLRDCLYDSLGGSYETIWILGGWYGVLSAFLLDDPRFSIQKIVSFDRNPQCAEVALSLNAGMAAAGKFEAITAEMENLAYGPENPPGLVINTSCEHVENLALALRRIPDGTLVVLQSNNYRREPDHVGCVDSLAEFKAQAGLKTVLFAGELEAKNYTRFMLIGRI